MTAHFNYLFKIIWFSILMHRNIFCSLMLSFFTVPNPLATRQLHSNNILLGAFNMKSYVFCIHWIKNILLCSISLNSHKSQREQGKNIYKPAVQHRGVGKKGYISFTFRHKRKIFFYSN